MDREIYFKWEEKKCFKGGFKRHEKCWKAAVWREDKTRERPKSPFEKHRSRAKIAAE